MILVNVQCRLVYLSFVEYMDLKSLKSQRLSEAKYHTKSIIDN